LEIVTTPKNVSKIVKAILKAARTNKVGDGKIFVYSIEKAYKISSGEGGEKVVS
jgi:nitrogen regulatory protein P-II 1